MHWLPRFSACTESANAADSHSPSASQVVNQHKSGSSNQYAMNLCLTYRCLPLVLVLVEQVQPVVSHASDQSLCLV